MPPSYANGQFGNKYFSLTIRTCEHIPVEGTSEAEGVTAASGVSAAAGVSFEEPAGEIAGGVLDVEVVGPLAAAKFTTFKIKLIS